MVTTAGRMESSDLLLETQVDDVEVRGRSPLGQDGKVMKFSLSFGAHFIRRLHELIETRTFSEPIGSLQKP